MGKRGGRPTVTFHDGLLPAIGKMVSKLTQSTALITGSTAARELLPPHFQYFSLAK